MEGVASLGCDRGQRETPFGYNVVLGAGAPAGEALTTMHGKVLAIRERSDSVPSCQALFAHSRGVTREIEIAIGGDNGAFYRPNLAWLQPLLDFVR